MLLAMLFAACSAVPPSGSMALTAGHDDDTAVALDTATGADTDADSAVGTDSSDGTETGEDPGADSGFETDSSAETGSTDPVADTGADTGTDTGADTGAVAMIDPALLAGRSYSFDLAAADITEPAGLGSVLGAYIDNVLLVDVLSADATTLSVRWGWSDPDAGAVAQDTCLETTDTTASFASNPAFATDPADTPLLVMTRMEGEGAVLSGTFAPDGTTIDGAQLTVLTDITPIAAEFGLGTGADMCALLASFGAACEACPSGATTCLRFTFDDMTGVEMTPLPLTQVTAACE